MQTEGLIFHEGKRGGCEHRASKRNVYLCQNFDQMMSHFAVRNGVISGAVQVAVLLLFYFISKMMLISFASVVCFFIYVGFMRQTVIQQRLEQGGYISFRDAFKWAWLTFIPSTVIVVLFNYLLFNFVDSQLIDMQREMAVDALEKMSKFLPVSDEDYEKQLEVVENQNPYGLFSLAVGLPVSFLFPGALIAAIMALIMKKENPLGV